MNQEEQQEFLLGTFREEVDGHIVSLTRALVELEEVENLSQGQEQVRELMRVLHTVKGAARMLGFADITKVAHSMEEVVGLYRDNPDISVPPRETIDILFEGIDTIAELTRNVTRRAKDLTPPTNNYSTPEQIADLVKELETLAGPARQPVKPEKGDLEALLNGLTQVVEKPVSGPRPNLEISKLENLPRVLENQTQVSRLDKNDEAIRVRLDKLDSLINAAGELVINKIQNDEHLQTVQQLVSLQRQRGRLASQLRELIIEHMPVQERNELLGMTELFSFPDENTPETSNKEWKKSNDSQVNLGVLDTRTVSRIYKKLEEIIVLDRKIEQISITMLRERKAYNIRFETMADELRRNMLGIRMLPLDTIFNRFQRPVRDLANERGKEVRLVLAGGSIEVDKRILEEITDPLIHLLRNAVDHGIETIERRLQSGKSSEGTIKLTALQKGSHVVIEVEDDGGGIDPMVLKQAAVDKGILTQIQAETLATESALDLIFRPGFSTRAQPDEISGRGFGMDIVQQNVKRLNGRVAVTSIPGKGTTFSLEIPLTLATMGALLIRAAGQLFALPSIMVNGIQSIPKSEIRIVEGKRVVRVQGQVTPMVDLAEVLGLPPLTENIPGGSQFTSEDDAVLAILLGANTSSSGDNQHQEAQSNSEVAVIFIVDELVDEREIVVKGLGNFLGNVRNIAGATVLGADGLALILDVFGLLQSIRLGDSYVQPTATPAGYKDQLNYWTVRPAQRVLIVDDSLATRELERSILEAAGYQVETARDGVEALQAARERPFDLVLTDVEMPNMDGFRLSSAIHNDPRLHGLPVVIVSSRDSEQDRRRGLEAGAQAYIVKSQFEQNRLLDTIGKLLD